MGKYKFVEWLKAAGIRALKTCAQTALATITVKRFHEVDWALVGSATLLAGILSLLTSIAGLPELDMNPAALAEQKPPEEE